MKEPIDRWLDKVVKTENCWEWQGAKYRKGYGHFRMFVDGKWVMYKAHRFSFEYFNKMKLTKNEFVCHTCDNPRCVNPEHLFIGNAQSNTNDKMEKGRHIWGRTSKNRWLTKKIADEIRLIYSKGQYTMKQVGDMFNTSASQVERIVNNKIWK